MGLELSVCTVYIPCILTIPYTNCANSNCNIFTLQLPVPSPIPCQSLTNLPNRLPPVSPSHFQVRNWLLSQTSTLTMSTYPESLSKAPKSRFNPSHLPPSSLHIPQVYLRPVHVHKYISLLEGHQLRPITSISFSNIPLHLHSSTDHEGIDT